MLRWLQDSPTVHTEKAPFELFPAGLQSVLSLHVLFQHGLIWGLR